MAYELWETASGNLLSTHATEAAALDDVRQTVTECGRESVTTFVLVRETARGTTRIAAGEALAALALSAPSPRVGPQPHGAGQPQVPAPA